MEIRPIKKSEWDKLRAFNTAEYSPNHILTDKTYYDWQFDNFANKNRDFYSTFGLFGKNGEIFGTFGFFLAHFSFFGKTVLGNSLCNLIVKKILRNLGGGYLLLKSASKLGDIAIDHAINDTAWPIFMNAGFEGENLKRYLYVINSKNTFYDLPISRVLPSTPEKWSFNMIYKFDNATSLFWQKIKNRYPITIERTAEYLNWRYAENTLVAYYKFAVSDEGGIKAIVILRIEEVKKENLEPMGVRVGRIVDFFSDWGSESFAILKTIEFCHKNSVDFLDFFTSGNFHKEDFLGAGFVDCENEPHSSLSILFNPISIKRKHFNFAVKKHPEAKLENWYTTKGGGDIDRPW